MTKQKITGMRVAYLLTAAILFLFLAGCCGLLPPAQNSTNSTKNLTVAPPKNATCKDEACFIAAANDCRDMSLTVTDDVGTFSYSSSEKCIFTKTLVSLNANESQEMKDLLEGTNMTCIYQKGGFDQRWVTSLIYGIEYCDGGLKDRLGDLTLFT